MTRILLIFGTRPEAIKMAPVVLELQRRPQFEPLVCVTGQHRGMLDDALNVFGIRPEFDLDIMKADQTLARTTAAVLTAVEPLLGKLKPDRILVHGDTTTTFSAALAGFYQGIPVGHVEAGLRTGNLAAPWPEEFNRRCVDMVADLHWAPTSTAAATLLREGIRPDNVVITGNTIVDALTIMKDRIGGDEKLARRLATALPEIPATRKLILVTGHRRESHDGGLANVCHALKRLASRQDTAIVWPVHPNPRVVETVRGELQDQPNVHLLEPLDYAAFVALMMRSYLIITDSGGIQEEAPTLSKPVLVTRDETERPEAVTAGTARVVGTATDRIVVHASELLDNAGSYERMTNQANPFGDGLAAARIADSLQLRHARRCDA